MKVPARFSSLRELENGRSVDSSNRISYRSAGRSFFHSALDFSSTLNPSIVIALAIDSSFDGSAPLGQATRPRSEHEATIVPTADGASAAQMGSRLRFEPSSRHAPKSGRTQ